jgi:hypothetical protein
VQGWQALHQVRGEVFWVVGNPEVNPIDTPYSVTFRIHSSTREGLRGDRKNISSSTKTLSF